MNSHRIVEPAVKRRVDATPWYSLTADGAILELRSDSGRGLDDAETAERLVSSGRNELVVVARPSRWRLALGQLVEPMNLMLIAVWVVSIFIGQGATGAVVLGLVVLNLTIATSQEIKAGNSMEALVDLQVRSVVVVRGGQRMQIDAAEVVPGDIVIAEAGDDQNLASTTNEIVPSQEGGNLCGENAVLYLTLRRDEKLLPQEMLASQSELAP